MILPYIHDNRPNFYAIKRKTEVLENIWSSMFDRLGDQWCGQPKDKEDKGWLAETMKREMERIKREGGDWWVREKGV